MFGRNVFVELNPSAKMIRYSRKTLFRSEPKIIPFREMEKVKVVRSGRGSGPDFYSLLLIAKDRREIPFGGLSLDQEETRRKAHEFAEAMGVEVEDFTWTVAPAFSSITIGSVTIGQIPLAFLIAIAVYAFWYRFHVGPWCRAMWGGTAPPFFIALVFFPALSFLRRLPRRWS